MKQLLSALLLFGLFATAFAQSRAERSTLDPAKFPFYHGVASGDPLFDRVIIWTRITLDPPVEPVTVNWEIATDANFANIVGNGTVTTDSSKDYTVKKDVTGLQANTWYYYRFSYDTLKSMVGRTKTLPVGTVNNLRFAVASCQDYQKGYYNAHRHLSQRNDIDAVLFLGDYTYEGGIDSVIDGRYHEPTHKTIELFEYRMRQSEYKLDPDLQEAHRQYPWITVWDDHETANNAYKDGAKNHGPGDGPWYNRKVNGVITYDQWMPIRMPDPNDTFKIFRRFTFGDLVDLHILDTRLYDRDKAVAGSIIPADDSIINDSTRNMLGPVQFDWLKAGLDNSNAQWQVLGQQVMMAPLVTSPTQAYPAGTILNPDQWDGYPFDRAKLYNHIQANNIKDVVVLTGDIHTGWANDLPLPGYDATHRQNSIGVEFVATSISSNNALPPLVSEPVIQSLAPYVRYVNLTLHGYYVLDITPARAQADFVSVSDVKTKTFTVQTGPSWYVNHNETWLNEALTPSVPQNTYPALAPGGYTSVGKPADNVTTVLVHPNPFYNQVLIQFNTWQPEPVTLEVYSRDGKMVLQNNLGVSVSGINYAQFDGSKLPAGFYIIKLKGRSESKSETVIKIN